MQNFIKILSSLLVLSHCSLAEIQTSPKIDNNITAPIKKADVPWVVDGHVLPPEPDKTLNDSTLT